MDVYHAFLSLKPGCKDLEFSEAVSDYLGSLQTEGKIAAWRLMRRKLGLGPKELGEFHIMIEFEGLAQFDELFLDVAARTGEIEERHHAVNRMVDRVSFALYRDFPDAVRRHGGERF
ncbi:MAG: hypothetical protein KDJ16_04825 [Hyphomicrobiales bacterium]|nr:hypothetical protein [Hyphomicrobiales bacterium]